MTLGEMVAPIMKKYLISGEINFTTEKAAEIMNKCEEAYHDGQVSRFDGISCEYPDWRFNLRSSNTEPLLRLNLEANNKDLMDRKLEEVNSLIKEYC